MLLNDWWCTLPCRFLLNLDLAFLLLAGLLSIELVSKLGGPPLLFVSFYSLFLGFQAYEGATIRTYISNFFQKNQLILAMLSS
jgi:hypothetical protein